MSADRDAARKAGNVHPRAVAALIFAQGLHELGTVMDKDKCQEFVRLAFGAPNIGHGTADAEWLSIPAAARHGWLNPPLGVPLHWSGGALGDGHTAIADGQGGCWSSDILHAGMIDNVTIGHITSTWPHLTWEGWTETECGLSIYTPGPPA